mmetsp:Transcript_21401/g.46367  ORF Transcript_21401/g.46367 Transcript_21401/m.46367 type:complete len:211 (-) Transcript_21401:759-1391(-)
MGWGHTISPSCVCSPCACACCVCCACPSPISVGPSTAPTRATAPTAPSGPLAPSACPGESAGAVCTSTGIQLSTPTPTVPTGSIVSLALLLHMAGEDRSTSPSQAISPLLNCVSTILSSSRKVSRSASPNRVGKGVPCSSICSCPCICPCPICCICICSCICCWVCCPCPTSASRRSLLLGALLPGVRTRVSPTGVRHAPLPPPPPPLLS